MSHLIVEWAKQKIETLENQDNRSKNQRGLKSMIVIFILGFLLLGFGHNNGEGGIIYGIGVIFFFILSIPFFHYDKNKTMVFHIFLWIVYISIVSSILGVTYKNGNSIQGIIEKSF